jgi:hypothetical protein
MRDATARPTGDLSLRVVRSGDPDVPWPCRELSLSEVHYWGLPRPGLSEQVNAWRAANRPNLARGLRKVIPARVLKIPHFYGQLFLSHIKANGERIDLGLASMRVVTTAGVVYICADMASGANDINLFRYHGIGTTNTAEAVGDTALAAESTTALNPDSTRATGSQSQGTSGNNATYTTVGTLTADASIAAVEHGIFTQAATGGGTMLDRSVFTTVNLASGDSLQATYVLTVNSGG